MQWFAQAPSNIALIKYMGKENEETNIPANPSLSYTLPNLLSNVVLEKHAGKQDVWEPLTTPGALEFKLSATAQKRFLKHLAYIKQQFNYRGAFVVRSNNNFPHSSGLASSASSFAALTKCAVLALSELTKTPLPAVDVQANWSRHGSGSSCRSFFSPWALWDGENISSPDIPYTDLIHQVIVISHAAKEVSSSKAHQHIKTSPSYKTRPERAKQNLIHLLDALTHRHWETAYQICWHEFQDMHQLFITSEPPFEYMTPSSKHVLNQLQSIWEQHGDGPLITMDAGPNIHTLYRPDQAELAQQFRHDYLIGHFDVL